VFVASTESREVAVFDVSDATKPALLTSHPVPGDVWSICKAGSHVYVGDRTATVDVIRIGP